MKILAVFAFVVAAALAERTSYDGYKVYHMIPRSEHQLDVLKAFDDGGDFDFWALPRAVGHPVNVMVAPEAQSEFLAVLASHEINYSVMINDVEAVFSEERVRQKLAPKVGKGKISFTEYHRYDAIQEYLERLADEYPDIVSLEDFATSTEGRTMTMIKIGTGNNPVILVDGGIHAREWIAPAQVLYIIQELVENEDNRHMIENTDWYIIPVLNPDGYEYSHTNTRMWRKTRSTGLLCNGVDGNRNFDFHWMETGASSSECSETYAGKSGFSEPETTGLSDVVYKYGSSIKLYLTFHSYGQYLLYPWGYTSALPSDAAELNSLAVSAEAAIAAVSGTRYTIGSSTNVLYAAAGGSDDWVKGVGGVELSYTIELPGGGSQGFDLPASRIQAVVYETFKGVEVYQAYIAEKFGR